MGLISFQSFFYCFRFIIFSLNQFFTSDIIYSLYITTLIHELYKLFENIQIHVYGKSLVYNKILSLSLSFSLPLFVLFLYSISNTYWNFGRIEICIINPPARCMCPPAGQSTHYDFKWNIKVDDNISWFFCVQSLSLWHSPRKPFNSQLELCIC